jgi:trigger factor
MEFKTDLLDEINYKVNVTISAEEINSEIAKITQQLSKTASIPGFRKGKIPARAIKQHYGAKLTEDAEQQMIRQAYEKSLSENGIQQSDVIGEPQIPEFNKNDDGSIQLAITFSKAPNVEIIEDINSLVPELSSEIEINDDEINAQIDEMAKKQAPFVPVTDRPVQTDDNIKLDFEGFVDGVAFEGGKAENYSLKIGSGSFIPGFEDQLIGVNIGEEKDITVTFPENYQAENLKGKEAVFKIKVNAIETKGDSELNEETIKKLVTDSSIENPTLSDLIAQVRNSIFNEKLNQQYQEDLKEKLIEALLEKHDFALPEAIVNREIDNVSQVPFNELSDEEKQEITTNEEKRNAFIDSLRPEAQQRVKTTYLIDALAKRENITVSDDELNQILYYEAIMNQQDPTQLMEHYKKNGYLPLIKMSILEDKVLRVVLDRKFKKEA